jgi:hypothetical protein
MFRRREGDEFVLVTQVAHARLSALIAAHFGNGQWSKPEPRAEVLKGIEMHDCGWPLHDDAATINREGFPTHAFEMPWETVLPIWADSTRQAAEAGAYAGLLVSLHGLALSSHMFKQDPHRPARQTFAINKFQHGQIEIQESLRKILSMRIDEPLNLGLAPVGRSKEEDRLLFNFRLLQMTDQLSINVCFDEVKFPSIEHVYARPGKPATALTVSRSKPWEFVVEPWPFEEKILRFELETCRIKARAYESNDDLRCAIKAAGNQRIEIAVGRKER